MPNVKRTPVRTLTDNGPGRRPIRPIDREKMRPWLERHLDQRSVPGVRWVDRMRREFEISWRHAARQGWSIERDACIFELWAAHTRKYIASKDKEKDPKRWKANFRCALNSLVDVERVTGITETTGSNAARRYRFLTPAELKTKLIAKKRQQRKKRRYEEDAEEEEMEEELEEVKVEVHTEINEDTIPSPTAIPDFNQLLSDSDVVTGLAVSSGHMSGCQIIQRAPSPLSTHGRSPSPLNSDGASDSEISNVSDEESAEAAWTIEDHTDVQSYHPNLWSEIEFSDSMYLGETVELETPEIVIDLTPRAEYWDLTNPDRVFI